MHYEVPVKCCAFSEIQTQSAQRFTPTSQSDPAVTLISAFFNAARRLRSDHRKRYFLGKVYGPANINFTGKGFMKMLAKYGKMNSHILKLEDKLPM